MIAFCFFASTLHTKDIDIYTEELLGGMRCDFRSNPGIIYTKTIKCITFYSGLRLDHNIEAIMKTPVIIALLEIQPSIVLVVQTNSPAMGWIFPFNICVMFSRPFTGSFYLRKCTIIYLILCKSCMSYDSFHLDSYYSLLFWLPILCSPVWRWNFSL